MPVGRVLPSIAGGVLPSSMGAGWFLAVSALPEPSAECSVGVDHPGPGLSGTTRVMLGRWLVGPARAEVPGGELPLPTRRVCGPPSHGVYNYSVVVAAG